MNSALTMHQIQVENSLRLLFLMILTANFTTGQFLRRIFDSSGHFAVFDDHKLYKKMRKKYLDTLKEKGNVCFIKWSRVFLNCAFLIRNLERLSISILPHFRFTFFLCSKWTQCNVCRSAIYWCRCMHRQQRNVSILKVKKEKKIKILIIFRSKQKVFDEKKENSNRDKQIDTV